MSSNAQTILLSLILVGVLVNIGLVVYYNKPSQKSSEGFSDGFGFYPDDPTDVGQKTKMACNCRGSAMKI